MDKALVAQYFSDNTVAWLQSSYQGDGYVFPTALARSRKTVSIIEKELPLGKGRVIDLGCGAGQLCAELAQKGYTVIGVDESESMLAQATESLSGLKEDARDRVKLLKKDILNNGLDGQSGDAVTALGVIGYLPNDDVLFAEAARLLRSGGIFVVSCRNRLLNMVSISDYTLREIEQGTAKELVQEIQGLYQQVPEHDMARFLKSLADASASLTENTPKEAEPEEATGEPVYTSSIEPRQHTPRGLTANAEAHGFAKEAFYGVHPHLMMAGLNRQMPPSVFNVLSSSLEALDHHPASLIWSSVFIGVFRKNS